MQWKWRKKLLGYVITRIVDDLFASEIAKGIDFLQAIEWVVDTWKKVIVETIKNCFAKYGIAEETVEDEDGIVDEEFNALLKGLADSICHMIAEEYVDFNVEICSFLPAINLDMVDWKVNAVKTCVTEYLRKEHLSFR